MRSPKWRALTPEFLALFGTGNQAFPNCRAICAVRPIERVQVYSPNAQHRADFAARMAGEKVDVVLVDRPRDALRGADIVCCATNAKQPVLSGEWLQPGQMIISIANSDVIDTRSEVDRETFARASSIIVNSWDSVAANRQIELLEPIEQSLVKRENVHELGDVVTGKVQVRQEAGSILYYKNNTGLAIQFAACGAILVIPREWFASQKYSIPAGLMRPA